MEQIVQPISSVSPKKSSDSTSILRIVAAAFFAGVGITLVSLYHWGIIFGGNLGLTLAHSFQGNILPSQTMTDWFTKMADSSAIIGIRESLIWILLPSLLILTALVLFKPKSMVKMTLIGLCIGGIIYGAAVVSNNYDANRKKKFFLNSPFLSSSQNYFDQVKYPGVETYFYEDIQRTIDEPEEIRFTFLTNDGQEKVVNFYLAKGFSPNPTNPLILVNNSAKIKITEESAGLKVEASNLL